MPDGELVAWEGKPIEEMDRDGLIAVINELQRMLTAASEQRLAAELAGIRKETENA